MEDEHNSSWSGKSWWPIEKKKCGRWKSLIHPFFLTKRWKSEVRTNQTKFGWWCPPNTRSEGILSKHWQPSLASINPMCLCIKCTYPICSPLKLLCIYTHMICGIMDPLSLSLKTRSKSEQFVFLGSMGS